MNEFLITGTVRGRIGHKFVVVRPDGTQLNVLLEGVETPKIGVDIIGYLAEGAEMRIRLVPDVTRSLLDGRARIIPSGRPEMTARMLARLLSGTSPASIRPGVGGMIDRTTNVDDPDIAWALSILGPEAERAGIALNVIDPMGLVDAPWEDRGLKDEILPADTSGEARALNDLKRLLHDGMTPACCRTILRIGRGAEVPSVDFVLPYSPLATGQSWSADIAGAWRDEVVAMSIDGEDARRMSSFREMALAFAPKYLGRLKGDTAWHVEQSFADTAAAIAFMNFGGSSLSVLRFQRLREAALSRADADNRNPPATATCLAAVLSSAAQRVPDNADDILSFAASIAKTHAPKNKGDLANQKERASHEGVFIELNRVAPEIRNELKHQYRKDLANTVDRLRGSPRAMSRMATFGAFNIPDGFEDIFDDVVGPVDITERIDFEDTMSMGMSL